ncbi:MAG: arylsulfatase [Gammaproteobacteria bacterium]|nr:arylsulfatase [Gammaproteobacteria bacterium]
MPHAIAKHLAVIAAVICLSSFSATAQQPNIVLLIGDDVGYSDLGAYGGEIDTPHLDALAEAGTRFANYHSTASCSPTRSILMTGVDHHRNGLGNMVIVAPEEHIGQPGYEGMLNDKVATLAEMLQANGYHTYHLGKWHLGNAPDKRPYNRGFERTITLGDTGADNWEQRSYLPNYDKAHWYADGVEHQLPDDFYSSKYFVDKAIEFIGDQHADGRPFFASIGFQAVHIPLQAPAEFTEKYHQRYQDGWGPIRQQRRDRAAELGLILRNTPFREMATTKSWDALSADEQAYKARIMAVYAGMLDAMDHHIGRLVTYLKSIGQYENTVFIFLSDNGAEPSDPLANPSMARWVNWHYSTAIEDLGKRGSYAALGPSWASAAASPGAFYKFWAGEGGVRVPLIISWPHGAKTGAIEAGSIEQSFAHVKDIMPTILALTNTADHGGNFNGKVVEPITGSSLLPVLNGQADLTHAPDKAIGYELAGNAALYKGDLKLLRNLPPIGDGEWHLYNIANDPGETNDLRDTLPQQFAEMQADYAAYEKANGVLPMPAGYNYIEQVEKKARQMFIARWWPKLLAIATPTLLLLVIAIALLKRRKSH